MENLIIRKAAVSDIEQLQIIYAQIDDLHCQALPNTFKPSIEISRPMSFYETLFADNNARYLVACVQNNIVGFIHAEIKTPEHPVIQNRKIGHITDIVIDKKFRQKGIGNQLFSAINQWFEKEDVAEMSLTVFSFNQSAQSYYQSLGFENCHCTMTQRLEKT